MGSFKESLAIRTFREERQVEYLKLLAVVQAIGYTGNLVASVVAGSENPPNPDKLNDLLGSIRGILMPELAEEKDDKAKQVKELMAKELNAGPFKVESMVFDNKREKGLN